jgi:3-oxoacyl-[acyl-carrier-protein] synthase-1
MGAMSSKFNQTPDKASRAYDADRDGFVISGGAGVLVLEELERAKARGRENLRRNRRLRRDLGRCRYGGAVRRRRHALHAHGARDRKPPVDYINPHATSTPIGDLKEIEAIREVFGRRKCPPISATKSLTGHSLGATGAQEAIYSLLMMNSGFICESANIEKLDPAFEDMPIVRERRDNVTLGCVLSNSFGFGGTNASIVLKHVDA